MINLDLFKKKKAEEEKKKTISERRAKKKIDYKVLCTHLTRLGARTGVLVTVGSISTCGKEGRRLCLAPNQSCLFPSHFREWASKVPLD